MKFTNPLLKLMALVFFLSIYACNSNSQSSKKPDTKPLAELQQQINAVTADLYKNKLDELLTPQIAAEAAGKQAADAKKKVNSIGVKYEFGKSGRMKRYKSMEYETTDYVELLFVKNFTLEKFKQMYHTPTDEELKAMEERTKAAMAKKVAEGKVTQQQADLAGGMVSGFGQGLSFDEVTGVGDYAVWNNKDKHINVFYRGIGFQLVVDVYADEATNKAKAAEAANAIIKQKL